MKRFEKQAAFVSGGGSGIGLACAEQLVAGGGKVMLAGRREDVLRDAVAKLGDSAAYVVCDVCDDASVESAVAATVDRFGGLSLAVNSAGVGVAGSIQATESAAFEAVIQTNLIGVFRCLRAQARVMKEAGGGSIVNVSSIAATLTHRWMSAYCASKAGLNMLTRCAADEWGEFGIRVNAVMPSLVATDMAAPLAADQGAREEYLRLIPLGRLGEPVDVATAVAFLLSAEAAWMTGQCIGVDGGHTIRKGPDLVELFKTVFPE